MMQFLTIFKDYLIEVLPLLAVGFLLSGLIHEFVPQGLVERYLGGKGVRPLLYSAIAGTVLPICCIGALPVALSMHQKGARLGPVLTFLVTTPATSVTALLVCYALLGIKFTIFLFFAVIVMGLIIGVIGNQIHFEPKVKVNSYPTCAGEMTPAIDPICGMGVDTANSLSIEYGGNRYYFCSPHCQKAFEGNPEKYAQGRTRNIGERTLSALRYGFWDMVKEIGPELLIGLVLAAVVVTITPVGKFIDSYLGGGWGYPFSLVMGMVMYICSTASVPLVDSLISQGMNIGAGMVLLMVGPVTSWSTIMVIRKEFSGRILAIYLAIIAVVSLALGYLFTLL